MRRTPFLMIPTLILVTSAIGQTITMSVTPASSGQMITVTNHSNAILTAFAITVDLESSHQSQARIYHDIYVSYGHDAPVLPNLSTAVPLPHIVGAPAGSSVPALRAALFSDGTSWGEPEWIDKLLLMRRSVAEQLRQVNGLLQTAIAQQRVKSETLSLLAQTKRLQAQAHFDVPLEQRIHEERIFDIAYQNIDGQMRVGGKIPDHPTALRKLSGFFDEWGRNLERSKPSFAATLQMRRAPQHSLPPMPLIQASLITANGPVHAPRLRPASLLMGQCSADDISVPLPPPDNCGSQRWELVATVQGTTYDEGVATAFGACRGTGTDCGGTSLGGNPLPGSKRLSEQPTAPNNESFTWLFTNWSVSFSNCNCDDPNPSGVNQVFVATISATAIFSVPAPGCPGR